MNERRKKRTEQMLRLKPMIIRGRNQVLTVCLYSLITQMIFFCIFSIMLYACHCISQITTTTIMEVITRAETSLRQHKRIQNVKPLWKATSWQKRVRILQKVPQRAAVWQWRMALLANQRYVIHTGYI